MSLLGIRLSLVVLLGHIITGRQVVVIDRVRRIRVVERVGVVSSKNFGHDVIEAKVLERLIWILILLC